MSTIQSIFASSLLLLCVFCNARAQYESFNLQLNASIMESNGRNQVRLVCYYQAVSANLLSNKIEAINRGALHNHGEAKTMSFWLNGMNISSGKIQGLSNYKEKEFESGVMAQFALPAEKRFIGSFYCKSSTDTSPEVELVSMPKGTVAVAPYWIVAVLSSVVALIVLTSIITCILCYNLQRSKKTHSIMLNSLSTQQSNLRFPEKNTPKNRQSHPRPKHTSWTNPLTTNSATGQREFTYSLVPKCELSHFQPQCYPTNLKHYDQIEYVDPPEEVVFDCSGGKYVNTQHDIELHVPEFSIPAGKQITVRIAVSLSSSLYTQEGVRPVSPIVCFCVVGEPNFKFHKAVKIVIPHFLTLAQTNEIDDMMFVKAGHGQLKFNEKCDGEASFEAGSFSGTLLTHHFCHFCIVSSEATNFSKANFRLIRILPRNLSGSWRAQYCVTYFLRTCLRALEKFYDENDYEVKSLKRFSFLKPLSTASLQVHFERRLPGGWTLNQDGGDSKVTASEVDFWEMDGDELKQMQEEELYPPRLVIKVNGNQATEGATARIRFTGAQQDMLTELSLQPLATRWQSKPCHDSRPLPTSYSLPVFPPFRQHNSNEPSLATLMNRVGVLIPSKWRAVGTQLGLSIGTLERIQYDYSSDCQRCFSEVFSEWQRQPSNVLPYEWPSLFDALKSHHVSEIKLAHDLEQSLSSATKSNTD